MGIWLSKTFGYLANENLPIDNAPRKNAVNVERELSELKKKHAALEQHVCKLQTSVSAKVEEIAGLLTSVTERVEQISAQQMSLADTVKQLNDKQKSMEEKFTCTDEKVEFLFVEQRKYFTTNLEEKTDPKPSVGNGNIEEGNKSEEDPGTHTTIPENLKVLRENYIVLVNDVSVSVEGVVNFLFQEGVISGMMKEEILAETKNRFSRASKVVDLVMSKATRPEVFETFYQATQYTELWTSADIIRPENKPHFVTVEEEVAEEEEEEETEVKKEEISTKGQVNLLEQVSQLGTLDVPDVQVDLTPCPENTTLLQQFDKLMLQFVNRSLEAMESRENTVPSLKKEQDFLWKVVEKLQSQIHGWNSSLGGSWEKPAFVAKIRIGAELVTGVNTRLDNVAKMWQQTGNNFDEETASFGVPVNGTYLFNVTICQSGAGSLEVSLVTSPDAYKVTSTYIKEEWTNMTHDIRSGSLMLTLSVGQEVSVYVIRTEGEGTVQFCRFSGCLISSSLEVPEEESD